MAGIAIATAVIGIAGAVAGAASGITNAVDKYTQIDTDRKKREQEKINKKLLENKLPPQYYPSLESREENVKEGAYTVDSIRKTLIDEERIPPGYSLDVLADIGFANEVQQFKDSENRREERYKDGIINHANSLIKILEDKKPKSIRDQEFLRESGLDSNFIQRVKDFTKGFKEGTSNISDFNSILNVFSNINESYDGKLREDDIIRQLGNSVFDASSRESKSILNRIIVPAIRTDLGATTFVPV